MQRYGLKPLICVFSTSKTPRSDLKKRSLRYVLKNSNIQEEVCHSFVLKHLSLAHKCPN